MLESYPQTNGTSLFKLIQEKSRTCMRTLQRIARKLEVKIYGIETATASIEELYKQAVQPK